MDDDILLSICIPTYNRKFQLQKTLDELQKCQDPRYDVIVSDNNSTDGTKEYLCSQNTQRIHYITHDHNICPASNAFSTFEEAKGQYTLFLLDKDRICTKYLSVLLDELEKNNCDYGYCDLESSKECVRMEYLLPVPETFIRMSYLSKHPSGYFFRTSALKKELPQCACLANDNFPFIMDVICSHFATKGLALIIHAPVIVTETSSESARVKSMTYNSENLWFAPKQVVERYKCFILDLSALPIKEEVKTLMYSCLIKRSLSAASIGYSTILSNEKNCAHYGIHPQTLSFFDLINISWHTFSELSKSTCLMKKIKVRVAISVLLRNLFQIISYKMKTR